MGGLQGSVEVLVHLILQVGPPVALYKARRESFWIGIRVNATERNERKRSPRLRLMVAKNYALA